MLPFPGLQAVCCMVCGQINRSLGWGGVGWGGVNFGAIVVLTDEHSLVPKALEVLITLVVSFPGTPEHLMSPGINTAGSRAHRAAEGGERACNFQAL